MKEWLSDYLILADLCDDDIEIVVSLIKLGGCKSKRSAILADIETGSYSRVEKYHDIIIKYLDTEIIKLRNIIANIKGL